jgi:hypothetical protein
LFLMGFVVVAVAEAWTWLVALRLAVVEIQEQKWEVMCCYL